MNADRDTLAVYDARAEEYASRFSGEPSDSLRAFAAAMPKGGAVLDLGCGPGASAAWLSGRGLRVTATDGSAEMAARAAAHPGVTARHETFAELSDVDLYDGIWANFSLLHAPRSDMPRHLAAIALALRPGGLLHLGLKLGTGERRDRLGRFYTYYEEGELRGLLQDAGLRPGHATEGMAAGLAGGVEPFILMSANA